MDTIQKKNLYVTLDFFPIVKASEQQNYSFIENIQSLRKQQRKGQGQGQTLRQPCDGEICQ